MPYTDKPQNILQEISPEKAPFSIYLLMGEEEYFTDKIEKKIVSTYMTEEAAGFNYTLLYGGSTSPQEIITACRRVPIGFNRTIVVLREAQELLRGEGSGETAQPLSVLEQLLERPNPHNILVLSFKNRKPSRRATLFKRIESEGLFVESKEIRDYQIEGYIPALASEHGLRLMPDAIRTVAEHIGTDLVRLDSEMEKLATALPPEARGAVTVEQVLKYTALNKEYSVFDLRKALAAKSSARAMRIAMMLAADARRTPIQMVIPVLFSYFADLLIAFYAPDKSEKGVMKQLDLKSSYQVRDFMAGLRHYSAYKVTQIISYLRRCDARSKGMYTDDGEPENILVDLVLFILN